MAIYKETLQSKEIEFLNKKKKNIKILNTRQIKNFMHKAENCIFNLEIPHDGEIDTVQVDYTNPSVIDNIKKEIIYYIGRIDNEVTLYEDGNDSNYIDIKFE